MATWFVTAMDGRWHLRFLEIRGVSEDPKEALMQFLMVPDALKLQPSAAKQFSKAIKVHLERGVDAFTATLGRTVIGFGKTRESSMFAYCSGVANLFGQASNLNWRWTTGKRQSGSKYEDDDMVESWLAEML